MQGQGQGQGLGAGRVLAGQGRMLAALCGTCLPRAGEAVSGTRGPGACVGAPDSTRGLGMSRVLGLGGPGV